MAKFVINVGKLSHTGMETNTEVEGLVFEIECAPDEIPATIKAAMPLANMMREMTKENNSHEWEKLCREANEANKKLHEAEMMINDAETRAATNEKKLKLEQEKVEELRETLQRKSHNC